MGKHFKKNNNLIKISVITAVFILIVAIIAILIFRYNVEGEKNLPFEITSIRVISTAQSTNVQDFTNSIIQNNDFYFYFEKNPDYKKEDSISKITFENFNIEKSSNVGTVNIYRPSENIILYSYTDEYKIENSLTYNGALTTNIASLEIGNQGGLIGFSIALADLGNYTTDNSKIINEINNGTLLSNLNLSNEDIGMKISFDIIIETSSNNKFKSTLTFDLPVGNIVEDGVSSLDKNNLEDIVFKRF